MERTNRKWLLLFAMVAGLLLKKSGAGLGFYLVMFSFILFAIQTLIEVLSINQSQANKAKKIISALFLFICIAQLQYWIRPDSADVVLLILWLILMILVRKAVENRFSITLTLFITFFLFSAALMNPRVYHNFFRASTYEDYTRGRYEAKYGSLADLLIDRYKDVDTLKSNFYFIRAKEAEAEKDYAASLKFYNQALDHNPDDANIYHRRGYLRLSGMELSGDAIWSAVKDFNRAIKLRDDYATAYFHRSLAYGYLGKKLLSWNDLRKACLIDSMAVPKEYRNKLD